MPSSAPRVVTSFSKPLPDETSWRALGIAVSILRDPQAAAELRRISALVQRYLRFGARSTHEVRAHLRRRGVAEPLIDRVITACQRQRLLDDQACAKLLATHYADKGYAWSAVSDRLRAKGFGTRLVSQALQRLRASMDDEPRARVVARAFLQRRRAAAGPALRIRLARALAGRGFDSELIARVLTETLGPLPESPE